MKIYNTFTQTLLWLIVACVSFTVGCAKDEYDSASFGNTAIITRDANAQNISYTIMANDEWSIYSDKSWCSLSADSGYGTEVVDIVLEPNKTSVERKATLKLSAGGVTSELVIIQSARVYTLAATPRVFNASVAAESFDIAVSSNTEWSATTTADWINLNGVVASRANTVSWDRGNGILPLSLDVNDTNQERTGTITIYTTSAANAETLSETITVTQSANDKPTITLSTTAINFLANESSAKSVYYYGTSTQLTATTDNTEWCTVLVSGNKIEITPKSNIENTTPRNTIVTVTAEVNGETASEQIVVSQSGNIAPQIFFYNSTYYVTKGADSGFDIKWLNLTGTNVRVESTENWVTVNSSTNSSADVDISANEGVGSRTATLRISYLDLKGNTNYREITIAQAGAGVPNVYYNDLSLMSAESRSTLRVIVDNPSATIGAVSTMSNWLTVNSAVINSGEIEIDYYAPQNQSDASRENVIYIPINIGSDYTTLCSVNVTQAGLGAPTISALKEVHVTSAQSVSKEIALWLEGGDNTNVDYSILALEYQTTGDTDNSGKWISNENISATGVLRLDIATNAYSEARSAIFTVVAKRGQSQTVLDIKVTQGGTATPALVGLPQEILFDYAAVSETFDFELLNGSMAYVVAVKSDYDMFTSPTANSLTEVTSPLTIGVKEYNGVTSSFREGIITLKVVNSHKYPIYYDILVRQQKDIAPLVTAPSAIYVGMAGEAGVNVPISTNETVVGVTSSNTNWLTIDGATLSATGFQYTATKNDTGKRREAYISVEVTNGSGEIYSHIIPVTQEAEPSSVAVDDFRLKYANAGTPDSDTHLIPVTVNTSVKSIALSVHENSSGLLNDVAPTLNASSQISFTATENRAVYSREATILMAITDDEDNVSYQTVKVTQPGTTGVTTNTPLSVTYSTIGLNIALQYDTDTYLVDNVEVLAGDTYFDVDSYTHTNIQVSFDDYNDDYGWSPISYSIHYSYTNYYADTRSATIRVFTESKDGRQSYYRDFTISQGYKTARVSGYNTRVWYSNSQSEGSSITYGSTSY